MTESGKIVVATVISVLAHVSLFTALALMPEPVPVPEERPADDASLEVTIQPTAPQNEAELVAVNAALQSSKGIKTQIDPENLKRAETAPENPTAIAAHHSRAASAKAEATPSVAKATPSPTPSQADTPTIAPTTAEPTPTPQPTPKDTPKEEEPGIDALGNYGKAVGNAIGLRSEFYRKSQKESLTVGEVHIQFSIDAQGLVSDVRVLSNTASPSNAACAVRAVKEAQIPPIPPERLAQLPGGRIQIVYTFTTFPNQ